MPNTPLANRAPHRIVRPPWWAGLRSPLGVVPVACVFPPAKSNGVDGEGSFGASWVRTSSPPARHSTWLSVSLTSGIMPCWHHTVGHRRFPALSIGMETYRHRRDTTQLSVGLAAARIDDEDQLLVLWRSRQKLCAGPTEREASTCCRQRGGIIWPSSKPSAVVRSW